MGLIKLENQFKLRYVLYHVYINRNLEAIAFAVVKTVKLLKINRNQRKETIVCIKISPNQTQYA
jgi:hypothetical protein